MVHFDLPFHLLPFQPETNRTGASLSNSGFIELHSGIGVCVELRGLYKRILHAKGDSNNGFATGKQEPEQT